MLLVLVKHSIIISGDSHFAGGKHAFSCMAKTLAAAGLSVHLVHVSDRASVMLFCLQHGLLSSISYESRGQCIVHFQLEGVHHHVVLLDVVADMARQAGVAAPRAMTEVLVSRCVGLISSTGQFRVIVDADESQQCGAEDEGACLFAALAERFQAQMAAFVQNVHFLPFGPSGTSRRTPRLAAAWQRIGGTLCVSCFVQDYVLQHAQQLGLLSAKVVVVPLCAWGVFGTGPHPDYGAQAHARLTAGSPAGIVVGMLKLTPEKGAAIFFDIARRLPEVTFLAVSGDPAVQSFACDFPNVTILPPQSDVNSVLCKLSVLLVPSIWLEAFGMVVVDAMLRGIPPIVSDLGGLPEAGMGQAQVVPVAPIQIPPSPDHTRPDWSRRVYPAQLTEPWLNAIHAALSSPESYKRRSAACRHAATTYVKGQGAYVQHMLEWLSTELPDGPPPPSCVQSLVDEMTRQSL